MCTELNKIVTLGKMINLPSLNSLIRIAIKKKPYNFNSYAKYVTETLEDPIKEQVTCRTAKNEIRKWSRVLNNNKIPDALTSAQNIVAHSLRKKLCDLPTWEHLPLTVKQHENIKTLAKCRIARMPIQYIVGKWDFYNLSLLMKAPVFIPRPETEGLVALVLDKINSLESPAVNVIDIGCGTGAIILSIAKASEKAICHALEQNKRAFNLASANLKYHGLEKHIKLYFGSLRNRGDIVLYRIPKEAVDIGYMAITKKCFDIIVSNPPYIPTAELQDLMPEVSLYESKEALDGGEEGMNVIQAILLYSTKQLVLNGTLFMEIDPSQISKVEKFIDKLYSNKIKLVRAHKDFTGKFRFVEITKYA